MEIDGKLNVYPLPRTTATNINTGAFSLKISRDLEFPFPTARLAQIAFDVLRVDAEPKRSGVVKKLAINDKTLTANFSAEFARQLRVAVNSFFESLNLITQTVDNFGPPVSTNYSHF